MENEKQFSNINYCGSSAHGHCRLEGEPISPHLGSLKRGITNTVMFEGAVIWFSGKGLSTCEVLLFKGSQTLTRRCQAHRPASPGSLSHFIEPIPHTSKQCKRLFVSCWCVSCALRRWQCRPLCTHSCW